MLTLNKMIGIYFQQKVKKTKWKDDLTIYLPSYKISEHALIHFLYLIQI